MENLLPWPCQRVTYPGIDNPMYDQDIEALTGMLLQAVQASLGIDVGDFFIVSDCIYNPGTNQYSSGIVFMNGSFYAVTGPFPAGSFLIPSTVNVLTVNFDDGQARPIYQEQVSIIAQAAGAGGSPQFVGNMNQYRIGNKYLQAAIVSLLATQAALGAAAFLPVGPGGVASYTDPRLVGDANFFNTTYALQTAVILKGGGQVYTPQVPTDPVNKGYVDNNFVNILAHGYTDLGAPDLTGGTIHTISLGTTLGSASYKPIFTLESLAANPAYDTFYNVNYRNRTTSSFDLYFRGAQISGNEHIAVNWFIIPQ